MAFSSNKFLSVGTKVRVAEPMIVPSWSKWDDDRGRISPTVKRRLQSMFFQANRKLSAEVVYVGRESEREALRHLGRVKIRVRDPSGSMLIITADSSRLVAVA